MSCNDDTDHRNDSTETKTNTTHRRRNVLKTVGTMAAALPVIGTTAAAAETTVDMVADQGCDPNGTEPCDEKVRSAAGSGKLLQFPAGTYRFERENPLMGVNDFGIRGEGDVTFTVPSGFDGKILTISGGDSLTVENVTVDQSADGATPGLQFGARRDLTVSNVDFAGQGIHPDSGPRGSGGNPPVTNALSLAVLGDGGTGTITNVTARNGGLMGAYNQGKGRAGIWVGARHSGTLTLSNCRMSGFPNNGVYASRTSGTVQIEGGTYRNNDISQVRIGSSGSYVEGATIEVSPAQSNSPNPQQALNQRGVWLEGELDAGRAVRNCSIDVGSAPQTAGKIVEQ
ncbi:hypothetical protein [Halostella pelagica]|uniref:hypothetical protein n=1 Tax=Halostella pelagica TaxID=2583824 RepID=UPI00108132B4|nr:hypothetical protein [Halostella pelagica]